ncbi:MAPEG family protein [Aquabacterium sp.]|uniref:MAPEG family protein n=1 Tax=Aquabacterium sp. TaxID=1872578 RepID=UPI003784D8EF
MTPTLKAVALMAVITWLAILLASLIRAKAWTPSGLMVAFGNREGLAEASGFAGRAQRAANNTLENFVLFAAIALVAHASGNTSPKIAAGAELFLWARLAYIPIYWIGIPFLRTASWAVGIVGMAMMLLPLF